MCTQASSLAFLASVISEVAVSSVVWTSVAALPLIAVPQLHHENLTPSRGHGRHAVILVRAEDQRVALAEVMGAKGSARLHRLEYAAAARGLE